MKRLFALALVALAIPSIWGQSLISSFSHSGTVSAQTSAGHYVRTRGGSPRSGFYWYWRLVNDQSTQDSDTIPNTGTSRVVKALNTFYSQPFSAMAVGSSSLSNTATSAQFDSSLGISTQFGPTLATHQTATATSSAFDDVEFTIGVDCDATFTVTGLSTGGVRLYDLTTGDQFYFMPGAPSSLTLEPGNYRLMTHISVVSGTDLSGNISNPSGAVVRFHYQMKLTPST